MMKSSVLDATSYKNILFEVLDGIPPSAEESEEAARFRKEIEHDEGTLKCRAHELGLANPLIEFSSSGEV